MKPRAASTQRRTRIQKENEEIILESALEIFSTNGFRGTTIDQIAAAAGMSKPNLLYYFRRKEDMHQALLDQLLTNWLAPLEEMDPEGEPLEEICKYIRRKLEMAEKYPRESRLFANEILQGAPHIKEQLEGALRELVDEKSKLIENWIEQKKLAPCDPRHVIFSIWATTQHYADFDVQICAILAEEERIKTRFEDAAKMLEGLYVNGLKP
ncbi:MAG: TetR family transcriptional regulator C-terminal domain-containing protein [Rhizobiaceae bacterium]|nr:TetR family transcriptional regulator C-terminal domain-containing protein [Rhizobiaceae bacterium]